MSWLPLHRQSETLAAQAHAARQRGEVQTAKSLWADAAGLEAQAADAVGADSPRTLGIMSVSAVALWYKAGRFYEACQLAYKALLVTQMPEFARQELRELLQASWNEQALDEAEQEFSAQQVVVSISGGETVGGGAPLDLILGKMRAVEKLVYRTVEHVRSMPFRIESYVPRSLRNQVRPWLLQSVPGSYQFAVAIEVSNDDSHDSAEITSKLISILRAVGDDSGQALRMLVPEPDYRASFLKLIIELAPHGSDSGLVEIKEVAERQPVTLSSSTRKQITDALRNPVRTLPDFSPQRLVASRHITLKSEPEGYLAKGERVLTGVLRALNLDDDWLELKVGGSNVRIYGVGRDMDDVLGAMMNKEIAVAVTRGPNGQPQFLHIEKPK